MIQENISLRSYNTFGIDVRARYFAVVPDLPTLNEIVTSSLAEKHGLLVLGGGSNILFTKDPGSVVLQNAFKGINVSHEDEDYYYVEAAAGENWHEFVQHCIAKGYAGVENLALIPGNVGASPMQNIGAYGTEIKDVFHSLRAYDLHDRKVVEFAGNDCEFGYRESVFKRKFKNRFVIVAVTYRLRKLPIFNTAYGAIQQELEAMKVSTLSIQAIAQAVINIRSSKLPDPKKIGNAGSFFKNPEVDAEQFEHLKAKFPRIIGYSLPGGKVKLAAGWLIEQCGWKGFRRGDAGCHASQALVLVNFGSATGEEIFQLSEDILLSVQQKFGITLEREVNIL